MEFGFTQTDMEAFDFSKESKIKETLLSKIKAEYFGALDDDKLDFLNAAGTVDEFDNPPPFGEKVY